MSPLQAIPARIQLYRCPLGVKKVTEIARLMLPHENKLAISIDICYNKTKLFASPFGSTLVNGHYVGSPPRVPVVWKNVPVTVGRLV